MDDVTKMVTIIMAAFSVHKSRSIAYRRYNTIEGFAKGIKNVIKQENPDYISVRVIRFGMEP